MTGVLRQAGLPAAALVMVSGVLGVQLANGGGSFEPLRPADPCATRTVTSQAAGIDGLSERLVLLGIDGAACQLGVSREALILQLADSGTRSTAELDALRSGLLGAVTQTKEDGTLPQASELVDDILDGADLNGFLKAAVRALPDTVIDRALPTDDVLTRTIEDLDLDALLANLADEDQLKQQIEIAVAQAVKDSLAEGFRSLLGRVGDTRSGG
jgi:hypothetical protein